MIRVVLKRSGDGWHGRVSGTFDRREVEAGGQTEGEVVQRIYDTLANLGCQSLVKFRGGERKWPVMAVKQGRMPGA